MALAVDLPGDQITGWLVVILSFGAAAFVTAWFNGMTKWRGGTQAGEARAIKNLEKWGILQEARAERAIRMLDIERGYAADLERIIRVSLGSEALPDRPYIPQEFNQRSGDAK